MQLLESPIPPLTAAALRTIICKRPAPPDHHLQEAGPSGSSFARGLPLRMTICKRPVPPDDHLQEASPSGWPSARGRSLRIIICKRPAPLDDHLQEAGPSGSSFAGGRPLILTTTTRAWKCIFETVHNQIKCVLSVKESNFNENNQNFHICLWSGPLSDETKQFHRDRYRDFFSRPKLSRPRPRLFFETKYFRDRYRDFFSRPNVFETDTETFFETKCFRDRYGDFSETKFFRDWYRDFCKS